MKGRVKYAKSGVMRFVGHLDLLRYFQKSIRRSGLSACYSKGFSPHMLISFADPLSVGTESIAEYFDLDLRYRDPYKDPDTQPEEDDSAWPDPPSPGEILEKLNGVQAEGIRILSVTRIRNGRKGNAMSLVTAAEYTFSAVSDDAKRAFAEENIARLMAQDAIPVEKSGKGGMRTVDLKPSVYAFAACEKDPEKGQDWELPAGSMARLLCRAGSKDPCKIDLLMKRLFEEAGTVYTPGSVRIRRDRLLGGEDPADLVSIEINGQVW